MKRTRTWIKQVVMLVLLLLFPVITGCLAPPRKPGPPPHAPAHGHRAKHSIFYFPSLEVYFYPDLEKYYWKKNGRWKSGPNPPVRIKNQLRRVQVDVEGTDPSRFHNEIREKHPGKNEGKGKGKGRGREKGKGRGKGRR